MVAYSCDQLSDNYVDVSDLYFDLHNCCIVSLTSGMSAGRPALNIWCYSIHTILVNSISEFEVIKQID